MLLKLAEISDKSGRLRAVLVKKKSRLDLYKEKPQTNYISKLLEKNHSSVKHIIASHDAHQETIKNVNKILGEHGFSVQKVFRAELNQVDLIRCLVVSVGGDGTVLDTSHFLKNSPLLGINSDPERSVGALCAGNRENFATFLGQVLSGTALSKPVSRVKAILNGKQLPTLALNEVLVAHKNPAATSRYFLKLGDIREEQISSGIWVATSSGSTGAIVSAGGEVQSFDDQRLQIRVREPYVLKGQRPKIFSKLLPKQESLEITSKMPSGQIFFDGPHQIVDFPIGSTLQLNCLGTPLKLFVTKEMEKRRVQIGQLRQAYTKCMCLDR